jgi:isopentenyl phosphate kinase
MSRPSPGPRELVFVKLGGSVITVKGRPHTPRCDVIHRLAREVASALSVPPGVDLLLSHGSGSFGHTTARRYATRQGVRTPAEWSGFAQVAAAAARLHRLVADAFLEAGLPVWSLQPSASALCRQGKLLSLATEPVEQALAHGLVPLLYGDVALDLSWGGTIVSTEEILSYLARRLRPARILLVGAVAGVFEADPLLQPTALPVPWISEANWEGVRERLGGSYATDVTGGMLAKVEEMVSLARDLAGLQVQILSGEQSGALEAALCGLQQPPRGTLISWSGSPPGTQA